MFYRDDMINFPNTILGKQKIDSFLTELEVLRKIEDSKKISRTPRTRSTAKASRTNSTKIEE